MGEEAKKLVEDLTFLAENASDMEISSFARGDDLNVAEVARRALSALAEAGQYTKAHERLDDLARERVAEAEAKAQRLQGERDEAVKDCHTALREGIAYAREAGEAAGRLTAAEAQVEALKAELNAELDSSIQASRQVEAMRKALEAPTQAFQVLIDSIVQQGSPDYEWHVVSEDPEMTVCNAADALSAFVTLSAPAEERSSSRDHAPTLRAALDAYDAAYDRIGADSFDSMDDRSRELLEHAHSMGRLARLPAEESAVYPDWQPIETLPREWISFGEGGDGTWHSDWCLFGRKHENGHFVSWVGLLDADHWLGRQDDGCCFDTEAPTHWMPLIPTPAEARSEQAEGDA